MHIDIAKRKNEKLRLLLRGYSGSGKTWSALLLATSMIPVEEVAVIDTENSSASLYAPQFGQFRVLNYQKNFGFSYNPKNLVSAIKELERLGFKFIIIDSLSHFWDSQDGFVDIVEKYGNKFSDWKKVNPLWKEFIDAILFSKAHIIACARTKTAYEVASEEVNGKMQTRIKKMGTKTIQRESLDYEFTTVLDLSNRGWATCDKDRTNLIPPEGLKIDTKLASSLTNWLNEELSPQFWSTIDTYAQSFKISKQEVIQKIVQKYQVASVYDLQKDSADKLLAEMGESLKQLNAQIKLKQDSQKKTIKSKVPAMA